MSSAWFEKFPQILNDLIVKWRLKHGEYVHEKTICSIVFFAESELFGPAVVKIVNPAYELFEFEVNALKCFDGKNVCQLYDADKEF